MSIQKSRNNDPQNNQSKNVPEVDPKQDKFAKYVLYKQVNFLSTLFPDPLSKQSLKYQKELVELEGKTALELRRITGEAQTTALKNMMNDHLMKGGIASRADGQEFAAEWTNRLQIFMLGKQRDFDQLIATGFDDLSKIKVPQLKERKEAYLIGVIDDYYIMMDLFAKEFKSALSNRIT